MEHNGIIEETSQYLDNKSFDKAYEQNTTEILVENETETALIRQKPIATETKQDEMIGNIQKLVGFEIPAYDEIALTYVASGSGAGEIETVSYKKDGDTLAILTLTYDVDNNIISITKT